MLAGVVGKDRTFLGMHRVALLAAACTLLAGGASSRAADGLLYNLDWSGVERQALPEGAVVLPADEKAGGPALKLVNATSEPKTFRLADLNGVRVSEASFALTGMVRHHGVEGEAYLEMWTVFKDGNRFFSRTLADRGAGRRLSGDSDWRRFVLAFHLREEARAEHIERLEVNLVLPGKGTVAVGPLKLVQPADSALATGGWWSERLGGYIGGIGGSILGLIGGLIGVLAGRHKARGLVFAMIASQIVVGLALLAAGVAALLVQQPWAVYYPLLLIGGLLLLIYGFNLPVLRRRYQQAELQRLAAQDM